MKVFVVSKSTSEDGRGYSTPVAVVMDDSGIQYPYSAEPYVLLTSPDQPQAIKAAAEVNKLSQAARDELGITFQQVAALNKQAEPDVNIGPGNTVYLSMYSGEDGRGYARVTGVYSWERKDDPYEYPSAFQVRENLQSYLESERKSAIQKEIAGLSPETKRRLGLK